MNAFAKLPLCAPGFVTVTVTAPALPTGVVAVICVGLTTTTLVAAAAPNVTVAPAAKFVPVIVTAVPPAADPLFGATLLTVGVGATTSAPFNGTITPNHGVLPPVHVVVAVWIPVVVVALASETIPTVTLGATVIPEYPGPVIPVKLQQGTDVTANIRSFACTVGPLVVMVAVVPPVEFPACPNASTFSKQALIGEQDAASDPAFHSLICNCKKLRLGLLGVTVNDVTPAGMLGQYQT